MEARFIIGAMSGTSADGVDAALVRIDGHGLQMGATLICHRHRAYHTELRRAIFAIRSVGQTDLSSLAQLGRQITLAYADVVRETLTLANMRPADVAAIAAHGQTLFHDPPLTIQWFDPSLLALETGCLVVSDFRRADCAAGGQGAPLVPFADFVLFRHSTRARVLVNIGGIANLTFIPPGAVLEDVIAFDCGPGNCISDYLCREFEPTGPGYDEGGRGALRGISDGSIVNEILAHPYFLQPPPKSTDGPAMIRIWNECFARALGKTPDYTQASNEGKSAPLATACHVTAWAIGRAISAYSRGHETEVIVSGGGVRNQAIMSRLTQPQPHRTFNTGGLGFPGEAKEAVAFALLGAATLDGIPSNLPRVTGAKRAVVLGSITPRV